jgi:hypothetical protein
MEGRIEELRKQALWLEDQIKSLLGAVKLMKKGLEDEERQRNT